MNKLIILGLFLISNLAIADTPEYIKQCFDCHGLNGVSTEPKIPTIAGASAAFMEEAFYSYKNDLRPAEESKYVSGDTSREATDMKQVIENLTEQQEQEAAKYFAAQSFVPAKQQFDAAMAKIGKKIHAKKCNKCHEDGGTSAADDAGILAGQWTPYLDKTMQNIVDGNHDVDKKMKKKFKKLSKKGRQALLEYYASQQD